MNRRELIKQLSVVPIAGSLLTSELVFGNSLRSYGQVDTKPLTAIKSIYDSTIDTKIIHLYRVFNCTFKTT